MPANTVAGLELTVEELRCCHFAGQDLSSVEATEWREEFEQLPRAEKCRDCPAAKGSSHAG